MPYRHFYHLTHLLLLLLSLHPYITLSQKPPPPGGQDYGSPIPTKAIIVLVVVVVVSIITCYIRHFVVCCGSYIFGATTNTTGGGANANVQIREPARRGGPGLGLDPTLLTAIPTFLFSDVKVHKTTTLECAVCLNEFVDQDHLRLLYCNHVFHPPCIDQWLASHVTCPVCRTDLGIQVESQSQRQPEIQVLQQPHEDEPEPLDQITPPRHGDDHHHDAVVDIGESPHSMIIKFPRSHSTGHSLVENNDRFTLKLPEEVRKKLVNVNQLSSPRTGFRSRRSVSLTTMPDKPDRWRFTMSPPFISRSGSHTTAESSNTLVGIKRSPRSLFKSMKSPVKSPLNRVVRFDDVGERSSDMLWPNNNTTSQEELELEEGD